MKKRRSYKIRALLSLEEAIVMDDHGSCRL